MASISTGKVSQAIAAPIIRRTQSTIASSEEPEGHLSRTQTPAAAGCIVAETTPTQPSMTRTGSTWSRNEPENRSITFWAS